MARNVRQWFLSTSRSRAQKLFAGFAGSIISISGHGAGVSEDEKDKWNGRGNEEREGEAARARCGIIIIMRCYQLYVNWCRMNEWTEGWGGKGGEGEKVLKVSRTVTDD